MNEGVDKSDGVPGNFREVVGPMIEAALLEQPEDIVDFAADFFEKQLKQKENEWCGSGEMNIHGSPVRDKQISKDEDSSPKSESRSPKAVDFEMNVDNQDAAAVSLENVFSTKTAERVLSTVALETAATCPLPNTAFSEHAIKTGKTEPHISSPTDGTHLMKLHSKYVEKFGDYFKLITESQRNSVSPPAAEEIICNRVNKTDGCTEEHEEETETENKMSGDAKWEPGDKDPRTEDTDVSEVPGVARSRKVTEADQKHGDVVETKTRSPNLTDETESIPETGEKSKISGGAKYKPDDKSSCAEQPVEKYASDSFHDSEKVHISEKGTGLEAKYDYFSGSKTESPNGTDGMQSVLETFGVQLDQGVDNEQHEMCEEGGLPLITISTEAEIQSEVPVSLPLYASDTKQKYLLPIKKYQTTEFKGFLVKEKDENVVVQKTPDFPTPETNEKKGDAVISGDCSSAAAEKQESHSIELIDLKDYPSLAHQDADEEKEEYHYYREVNATLEELLNQVSYASAEKQGCNENCEGPEIDEDEQDGVVACEEVPTDQFIPDTSGEEESHSVEDSGALNGEKCSSSVANFGGFEILPFGEESSPPRRKAPRISSDSLVSWEASHAQRYKEWVDRNKNLCCINPKFKETSFHNIRSVPACNRTCFGKNVPCGAADCQGNWCRCGAQPKVLCINHKKQWHCDAFSGRFRTSSSSLNHQTQAKAKQLFSQTTMSQGASKLLEDSNAKDESRPETSVPVGRMKQKIGKIFASPLPFERVFSKTGNNLPFQSTKPPSSSRYRIPAKRKCGTMYGFLSMEGDSQGNFAPSGMKTDVQSDSRDNKKLTEECSHETSLIKSHETGNEVAKESCVNVDGGTWKEYPIVLCEEQEEEEGSNSEQEEVIPEILKLELRDINNNAVVVEPCPPKENAEWQRMEDNEIFLRSLDAQEFEGNASSAGSDDRITMWDYIQEPEEDVCVEAPERYYNIECGDFDDDYVIIEDMINPKDSVSKKSSSLSERSSSDERTNIDSADSGEGINVFDANSMKSFMKDIDSQEKMFVGEGGDMPGNGTAKHMNEHKEGYGMSLAENDIQPSRRSSDSVLNLKTPCVLESSQNNSEEKGDSVKGTSAASTNDHNLLDAHIELADIAELLKIDNNWTKSGNRMDDIEYNNRDQEEITKEITVAEPEESHERKLNTESDVAQASNPDETAQKCVNATCEINTDENDEKENNVSSFQKCEENASVCENGDQEECTRTPKWPFRDVLKPNNQNEKCQNSEEQVASEESSECVDNTSTNNEFSIQTNELVCQDNNEGGKVLETEDGAVKSTHFSEVLGSEGVEQEKATVTTSTENTQEDKITQDSQKESGNNLDQTASESAPKCETFTGYDGEAIEGDNVMTSPVPPSRIFARDRLPPLPADDRCAGFIHIDECEEDGDSEDLSNGQEDSESDQDTKN